jgi:hypothetical protein
MVNGASAFLQRTWVTRSPVLSWTAPSVGTPNGYVVWLYRLWVNSSGGTGRVPVAVLYTAGTQLMIPPNLMAAGEYYFFRVRSTVQTGVDLTSRPFRLGYPSGNADVFTAKLSP